jgi:hypothetical protein
VNREFKEGPQSGKEIYEKGIRRLHRLRRFSGSDRSSNAMVWISARLGCFDQPYQAMHAMS